MPITPIHFGLHGLVWVLLNRYIDLPTFLLTNIAIDIEAVLSMLGLIQSSPHAYLHTFLGGALISLPLAFSSYLCRNLYKKLFALIPYPYETSFKKTFLSAFFGTWLHILTDAPIYSDMNPFAPFLEHPFAMTLSYHQVQNVCIVCGITATLIFYIKAKKVQKQQAYLSEDNQEKV